MGTEITISQTSGGPNGSGYGRESGVDPALVAKVKDVEEAILAGLPSEAARVTAAMANASFFNCQNASYVEKREGETDADYIRRPKRTSRMTRKAVTTLGSKLYSPAPTRTFRLPDEADLPAPGGDEVPGSPAAEWLEAQYEALRIDVVMDKANQWAILSDCSAIQVSCTGDPDKPVRLYTYAAQEFAVFCPPDDPCRPWAVVTMAVEAQPYNKKRRVYTLWTDRLIRTYKTRAVGPLETTGGTRADQERSSKPNPYGVLPFVFVHNETPVDRFWGGGIGDALREANQEVDRELSDLAQQIQLFSCPDMFSRNTAVEWRYEKRPGRPQRLTSSAEARSGDTTQVPEVFYVQPQLAVQEIWDDALKYINQTFYELDIPLSASRDDAAAPTSGLQVIALQIPLLDYLKRRQLTIGPAERDLARLILAVAGAFYEDADLAEAAHELEVDLVWPEPTAPVPAPEADASDQWELAYGLASPIQLIMRRRGITRTQAVDLAKQIAADNALWAKLFPDATAPGAIPGSPPASSTDPGQAETDAQPLPGETPAPDGDAGGEGDTQTTILD